MKAATSYLLVGAAIVAAVASTSSRPKRRVMKRDKDRPLVAEVQVAPETKAESSPFGLAITPTGAIQAEDFAAWFQHAPQAFEDVLASGKANTAEDVLLAVLRQALPRLKWPPRADSPHRDQYLAMIETVATHLGIPTEPVPTRRHLSVVE